MLRLGRESRLVSQQTQVLPHALPTSLPRYASKSVVVAICSTQAIRLLQNALINIQNSRFQIRSKIDHYTATSVPACFNSNFCAKYHVFGRYAAESLPGFWPAHPWCGRPRSRPGWSSARSPRISPRRSRARHLPVSCLTCRLKWPLHINASRRFYSK